MDLRYIVEPLSGRLLSPPPLKTQTATAKLSDTHLENNNLLLFPISFILYS